MLNIKKETSGSTLTLRLSGAVDETVDFSQSIGQTPETLVVYSNGVTRMNSTGMRAWAIYFKQVDQSGTRILLRDCSAPLVQLFNTIGMPFRCEIESFELSYACEKCQEQQTVKATVEQIRAWGYDPAPIVCPKCQGRAVFDDIAGEFFAFLKRLDRSAGPTASGG